MSRRNPGTRHGTAGEARTVVSVARQLAAGRNLWATAQRSLLSRIESLERELGRLKTPAPSRPVAIHAATPRLPDRGGGSEPSASRRDLVRYGAVALAAAAGRDGGFPC